MRRLDDDTTPDASTPLPMQRLAEECRTLDVQGFERRFGAGFLLHQGQLDRLHRMQRANVTRVSTERRQDAVIGQHVDPFFVFPLRRSVLLPSQLTVGRSRSNDVVLGDASVSKLHAYIDCHVAGKFLLRDAGSTNGSFVDDRAVTEVPVPFEPGAVLRFGGVELTFLGALELHTLLQWGAGS